MRYDEAQTGAPQSPKPVCARPALCLPRGRPRRRQLRMGSPGRRKRKKPGATPPGRASPMFTAVRPRPTQNSGRILNALPNPSGLVYVIDDDVHIRRGLARLFESVGLQVETFAATTEFLRSLRNDVPQCLVLEVRLQ